MGGSGGAGAFPNEGNVNELIAVVRNVVVLALRPGDSDGPGIKV